MDDYLTNDETGLETYACLCFKCRRVTGYGRPFKWVRLAENGIEYFRTKPLTLQLLFDFHQNAQKHGNEVYAKMDKLVQNRPKIKLSFVIKKLQNHEPCSHGFFKSKRKSIRRFLPSSVGTEYETTGFVDP